MESDLGVIVIHSKSKTHHFSINIFEHTGASNFSPT